MARTSALIVAVLALGCLHRKTAPGATDAGRAVEFLAEVRSRGQELDGPAPEKAYLWLDERKGDLDHSLRWLAEHDPTGGVELASLIRWYWTSRARLVEGRAYVERVASSRGVEKRTEVRARALVGAGVMAFRQGDNDATRSLLNEAMAVAKAVGDRQSVATCLVWLGRAELRSGDTGRAASLATDSRRVFIEIGDRRGETGPLNLLGEAARMDGDFPRAKGFYEESLAINREVGQRRMVAIESSNLASVAMHERNWDAAARFVREFVETTRDMKDLYLLPYSLVAAGELANGVLDFRRAALLLAAGDAVFRRSGAILDPGDRAAYEEAVRSLQMALGADFKAAWEQGSTISVDTAVGLALGDPLPQPTARSGVQ